jgi:hypothetical protein
MRILKANLTAFVKESLLSIRTACEEAIAAGLIVELPTHVDFQVEVVQNAGGVTSVTATAAPIKTTTEAAHNIVTTEAPATDETTVTRTVTQNTTESGADTQTQTYDYGDYE